MENIIKKITNIFPTFPRKRFNIFCGTNDIMEWRRTLVSYLKRERFDDIDLIHEYEAAFAKKIKVNHAISFGAGRMALYAILKALGIGEGHEVILPAFTCVVVPNAVIYGGAKPVYADIESKMFNINIESVARLVSTRTRALYAQHTFGIPCDIAAMKMLSSKHGLPIIEDCGHALGAIYQGNCVGTLTDVGYFTTDHSKSINTHLGGMAVTNDDDLATRLRNIQSISGFLSQDHNRKLLRTHLIEYILYSPNIYWFGKTIQFARNKLNMNFYFNDELLTEKPTSYPYPCRLSSPQARLGISQLAKLDMNLSHRRRIAGWLEAKLGWYGFEETQINNCAWLRYSFLVRNRSEICKRFSKRFDLGIWFTSIAEGRTNELEKIGYQYGSCPVGEMVSRHIVNFPTHQRIPLGIIRDTVENDLDWLKHQILR